MPLYIKFESVIETPMQIECTNDFSKSDSATLIHLSNQWDMHEGTQH
jgi:hypothetical protein